MSTLSPVSDVLNFCSLNSNLYVAIPWPLSYLTLITLKLELPKITSIISILLTSVYNQRLIVLHKFTQLSVDLALKPSKT